MLFSCNCKKDVSAAKHNNSIAGNWELTYISGPKIAFDGLYPNAKPTITFDEKENRVSGKNSCNNYSGKFTKDGNNLNIDENAMISTKMFCEGNGERTYMDALGKVNAYTLTDNGKTLNLIAGDVEIMRFTKK